MTIILGHSMQNHSIFRLALVACSAVLLIACAGPNAPKSTANQMVVSDGVLALLESDESVTLGDPRIRCERRQALGSRFRVMHCMTQEEFDRLRDWSLRDSYGTDHRRVN